MNKILRSIVFLSLFTPGWSGAALERSALKIVDDASLTKEAKAEKDKIAEKDTKAIFLQSVPFNLSAFYAANFFYLGASGASGTSALVRASIGASTQTNLPAIMVTPLAPTTALINGSTTAQANPFTNAAITNLTLMSQFPVLTFDNGVDPNTNQLICLITDINTGKIIFTNAGAYLNDASGTAQTAGIVALASTFFAAQGADPGATVFAAVRPNAGTWGQANSGIAVLGANTALTPTNAQAGGTGNKATLLDPTTFTISGSVVVDSTPVVMYWDSQLGRLYVGLQVRRGNASVGGGVALLVGYMNGGQLILQPFVPALSGNFVSGNSNYPVGFLFGAATPDVTTSIYDIKTMHTTTGRSYVIVNGGTHLPGVGVQNQVYALPALDPTYAAAQTPAVTIAASDIGRAAGKTSLTANTLISASAQMTQTTDAAALIGGGTLPIQSTQSVQKMFVVGNAVFACVAQDRSAANNEAGIFQSQALFDQTGGIRSWTPWRRVMGSVDPVFGGGLDNLTGNYWYLTNDSVPAKTMIKVTQWGDGENNPGLLGGLNGDISRGLVSVLGSQFLTTNAGVHQLFDFDTNTPGFATGQFSMMVATGLGQVALIESGRSTLPGVFTPNKGDFLTNLSQNIGSAKAAGRVQVFTGGVLSTLGPLNCAECSRIAVVATSGDTNGWLFVSGRNGVAVLSDASGVGWETSVTGLNAGFAGLTSSFTFKKVGNFTDVRKVVCDGAGNAYVVTGQALYRISLSAAKFATSPASLGEQLIATPFGVTGSAFDSFLDFIIIGGNNGILATTSGLFTLAAGKNIKTIVNTLPGTNWAEVKIPTASSSTLRSLDCVNSLFFLSDNTTNNIGGNLFAMAADLSLNVAVVYQFDVDNANNVTLVTTISGVKYFFSAGELRTSFFSQGGIGFHLRPKHFGDANFLKEVPFSTDPLAMRTAQQVINLGSSTANALNCGLLTYNSASGALLLPFDVGIKINE